MRPSPCSSLLLLISLIVLVCPNSGTVVETSFSGTFAPEDSSVITIGTGTTNVIVNTASNSFTVYVTITTQPTTAIQLCHIHYATTPGGTGAPIYNMTKSNSGDCNSQTTFTLNTGNNGYSGGDLAGFAGGYYYVNIHTTAYPNGEIYGFLGYANYTGTFGADSGVTTNAAAVTNVVLTDTTFTVYVTVSKEPVTAIQLCHIHYATTPGGSGVPIYNMTTSNSGGCNSQTTFTLNSWNTGNNGSSGGDLAGFAGGNYYVNIHTTAYPNGEIYAFLQRATASASTYIVGSLFALILAVILCA